MPICSNWKCWSLTGRFVYWPLVTWQETLPLLLSTSWLSLWPLSTILWSVQLVMSNRCWKLFAGSRKRTRDLRLHTFLKKHVWVKNLKVILADSLESPYFPIRAINQGNKPAGVERIIHVSRDMAEASRSLLHHQAGILTGQGGGLAGGVAFTLANKIGVGWDMFNFFAGTKMLKTSSS